MGEVVSHIPAKNIAQTDQVTSDPSFVEREPLDMIDMITTALDVGIMTGIVLFVAFGLALRRDSDPHRRSFE